MKKLQICIAADLSELHCNQKKKIDGNKRDTVFSISISVPISFFFFVYSTASEWKRANESKLETQSKIIIIKVFQIFQEDIY